METPPMLDAAVAFGRVLRGAGLRVGTDRLVEFARAIEEMDPRAATTCTGRAGSR